MRVALNSMFHCSSIYICICPCGCVCVFVLNYSLHFIPIQCTVWQRAAIKIQQQRQVGSSDSSQFACAPKKYICCIFYHFFAICATLSSAAWWPNLSKFPALNHIFMGSTNIEWCMLCLMKSWNIFCSARGNNPKQQIFACITCSRLYYVGGQARQSRPAESIAQTIKRFLPSKHGGTLLWGFSPKPSPTKYQDLHSREVQWKMAP